MGEYRPRPETSKGRSRSASTKGRLDSSPPRPYPGVIESPAIDHPAIDPPAPPIGDDRHAAGPAAHLPRRRGDGPPRRARGLQRRRGRAHPPLPHPRPCRGRPAGRDLDGGGGHERPRRCRRHSGRPLRGRDARRPDPAPRLAYRHRAQCRPLRRQSRRRDGDLRREGAARSRPAPALRGRGAGLRRRGGGTLPRHPHRRAGATSWRPATATGSASPRRSRNSAATPTA